MSTLYERLGGAENIDRISHDIVARHNVNPLIRARFTDVDDAQLGRLVAQFFAMGSGGPADYDGRSMPEAHKGMNINEVLAILYSLKGEVLAQ